MLLFKSVGVKGVTLRLGVKTYAMVIVFNFSILQFFNPSILSLKRILYHNGSVVSGKSQVVHVAVKLCVMSCTTSILIH